MGRQRRIGTRCGELVGVLTTVVTCQLDPVISAVGPAQKSWYDVKKCPGKCLLKWLRVGPMRRRQLACGCVCLHCTIPGPSMPPPRLSWSVEFRPEVSMHWVCLAVLTDCDFPQSFLTFLVAGIDLDVKLWPSTKHGPLLPTLYQAIGNS